MITKARLLPAAIASFVMARAAMSQGTLYVGNAFPFLYDPVVAPIYGPNPTQPTVSLSGQSSIGTPAGTTVYGGQLLEGSGWTFAAFAGPTNAQASQLSLIVAGGFGTGVYAGILFPHDQGYVPGVPVLYQAKYQIRVWDNLGHTINSWPQALAAWEAGVIALGQSELMISYRLGGNTNGISYLPPPTPFTSFNVAYVPEPYTAGLLLLALVMLAASWKCK